MKKRILLVTLLLFLATFAFSDTGLLLSIGINETIPINQQVDKEILEAHYLLFMAVNVEVGYAFDTGSDFFQLGLSAVFRQNPITLLTKSFFGELSFRLYNNIDLGLVEFRPYTDIGITSFFIDNQNTTASYSYYGFLYANFSIGMSFSIGFFEIDCAYTRPIAYAIGSLNYDPSSIRIGLAYKFSF